MRYEVIWKHTLDVPDATLPADAARMALAVIRGEQGPIALLVRESVPHAHSRQVVVHPTDAPACAGPGIPGLVVSAACDERVRQLLEACYHALTPVFAVQAGGPATQAGGTDRHKPDGT